MSDFHLNAMLPLPEVPCGIGLPTPRLPEFERPADPRLVADGWQRRFMADGQRLTEYVDLYSSLGYEIRTEIVQPEEIGPECTDCRLIVCRQYVTLYTRRQSS